jgi:hypothetical protein
VPGGGLHGVLTVAAVVLVAWPSSPEDRRHHAARIDGARLGLAVRGRTHQYSRSNSSTAHVWHTLTLR